MAVFPKTEAEILAAAQQLIGGLAGNPAKFPAPPVTAVQLQALVDSYTALRDQANAAYAAYQQVEIWVASPYSVVAVIPRPDQLPRGGHPLTIHPITNGCRPIHLPYMSKV